MINIARYCKYLGHHENETTYICTYPDCNQASRWVCVDCMTQQLHQHKQENQHHVMKTQGLQDKLLNQFNPIIKQQQIQEVGIQNSLILLKSMIQHIGKMINNLHSYLKEVQNIDINSAYRNVMKTLKQDISQVDAELIIKLLKYQGKQYRIDISYGQEIQRIISLSNKLYNQVKNCQNVEKTQIKYVTQFQTKYERGHAFQTAISLNEQYFAFLDSNQNKLIVQSLISNQIIKVLESDIYQQSDSDPSQRLKFTDDSQYLYVSIEKDLICYEAKKFERICQFQFEESIQDFILMENFVILTLLDYFIITTDLRNNKQIQKIDTQDSSIMFMEFDRVNNYIICSSNLNKSIKFFDKSSGQLIFQKSKAHQDYIDSIQLIQNNTLLTVASRIVKLWQIDYKTNQMNLINKMYDWSQICNASYVQNNILVVCKEYIKIFDLEFKPLQEIEHDQSDDVIEYLDKQISLNYLVVYGDAKVSILKRQILNI